MKILLYSLLLLGLTATAQTKLEFTPTLVTEDFKSGESRHLLDRSMIIEYHTGGTERLEFDLVNKNGGPTTAFWAVKNEDTYFYDYMDLNNNSGETIIYRSLKFYSRHPATMYAVAINVPKNFDRPGWIGYVFWDEENGVKEWTRTIYVYLTPEDAKKAFYFAARAVKKLNLRKTNSQSLYIDVD